jgi:deoxyribodipyrimidine photo-lyase
VIQSERLTVLRGGTPATGAYVLYWMQASQRASFNHALEYAIEQANDLRLPVGVLFCLMDDYPEANLRHYAFMLEGLRETIHGLNTRGMSALVAKGSPMYYLPRLARRAAMVVTDRGYLRHQRRWRAEVARLLECPFVQVETDAIVPVETASPKAEYAAATLRPKLGRLLLRYLVRIDERELLTPGPAFDEESLDLRDTGATLKSLSIDRSVPNVSDMPGGSAEAERRLAAFLDEKLDGYAQLRSNPATDFSSGLSAYLHFGQISPLRTALAARDRGGPGADAFLEELIIRRELSINYVQYNEAYDSLAGLPGWAQKSLKEHETDRRPYLYDLSTLEQAGTHDTYWNAAQREMVTTGKMHNYMRMYWGKKILEWSPTPAEAFTRALYLNNRWQLDGRDPNSYAGVAWCFGMHDRPWGERPVFGNIRYMNAAGLERKFPIGDYVALYGPKD